MGLLSIFSGVRSKKRTSSPRPQSVRLGIESLEDRLVPSASSSAMHAVAVGASSAAFFINKVDHAFYEKTPSGATIKLSGPNSVQAFSAGLDANGADVFAKAGDNSMWEYNSSGWHKLYEPIQMKEFAAVQGGRAYAVGIDDSLWKYSPPFNFGTFHFGGWQRITLASTVQHVDAVTQTSGQDAVFDIAQNGVLQEYVGGSFHTLAVANYFQQTGISAGLDLNGNADVFGLSNANHQLWRWTTAAGWTALGAPNTIVTISATNAGQVFCITNQGWLEKFDAQNTLHDLYHASFTEVSAVASNDVYVTNWDHSLWERTGGGAWHQWEPANTVL